METIEARGGSDRGCCELAIPDEESGRGLLPVGLLLLSLEKARKDWEWGARKDWLD